MRHCRSAFFGALWQLAAAQLIILGWTFPVLAQPQRVVSTVLAVDEVLAEIAAPGQLAGVTIHVDNPAISNGSGKIPAAVFRHHGSIEEILALEPDSVFTAGYSTWRTVKFMNALAVPVVEIKGYDSFAEITANIRLIAQAIGQERGCRSRCRTSSRCRRRSRCRRCPSSRRGSGRTRPRARA